MLLGGWWVGIGLLTRADQPRFGLLSLALGTVSILARCSRSSASAYCVTRSWACFSSRGSGGPSGSSSCCGAAGLRPEQDEEARSSRGRRAPEPSPKVRGMPREPAGASPGVQSFPDGKGEVYIGPRTGAKRADNSTLTLPPTLGAQRIGRDTPESGARWSRLAPKSRRSASVGFLTSTPCGPRGRGPPRRQRPVGLQAAPPDALRLVLGGRAAPQVTRVDRQEGWRARPCPVPKSEAVERYRDFLGRLRWMLKGSSPRRPSHPRLASPGQSPRRSCSLRSRMGAWEHAARQSA